MGETTRATGIPEHIKSAYVSGPMTNRPEFNFPTFGVVTDRLRTTLRWRVVSPAEHDQDLYDCSVNAPGYADGNVPVWSEAVGFDYATALAWDFAQITQVDAIVMLPEWETSNGAKAERFVAENAGKAVFLAENVGDEWHFYPDPVQKRLTVSLDGDFTPVSPNEPIITDTVTVPLGKAAVADNGEIRVVDPVTGGAKGQKPAQLGALDPAALLRVAEVAGFGATKYDRFNFAKGYAWSLSVDALCRHLLAFLDGRETDPESGLPHMAHAAWHCLALLTFSERGIGTDDRLPTTLGQRVTFSVFADPEEAA